MPHGQISVLVMGGGGREHALVRALRRSPRCGRLICAPGSNGIGQDCRTRPVDPLDANAVAALCREEGIDLVVIGPEAPLVAGVADGLRRHGIAVLGPGAAAARLEGSKRFTKEVCAAAGVPTARSRTFDRLEPALEHLKSVGAPIVIKADGLAAGKGVTVADTIDQAEAAVRDCLAADRFGAAGQRILVEEKLTGTEVSYFVLADRSGAVAVLGSAQDHKRLEDGDTGPNTGGMGAVSPAPALTTAMAARVDAEIVAPTLREMARRGQPFEGILFCGLMIGEDGPKLIEFNVRFGDPEAQAILPRFGGDLLDYLDRAAAGRLTDAPPVTWTAPAAAAVVLATRGYPAAHGRGSPIRGLEALDGVDGIDIFHAGTRRGVAGWQADGGRVLAVAATGPDPDGARASAYRAVDRIDWPEGTYRTDIGVIH